MRKKGQQAISDVAILRRGGDRYEYYGAADGRNVFKFLDLPDVVRSRVLSSAGSRFAALGPQRLTSEAHAAGREVVGAGRAPAPGGGIDAGDSEARSRKKSAPADALRGELED